ncbi:hypothetical protein Tco_0458600 [Tanacetum coccineum]
MLSSRDLIDLVYTTFRDFGDLIDLEFLTSMSCLCEVCSLFHCVRMATNLNEEVRFAAKSTKKMLCTEFEKLMHKKFQMSSMGQPKLGLWYPKDSPFDLEAYSDSDYAGASLDRKSTTRGQVSGFKIKMLNYGYNFMNTKIFIDNESTICIVKNPFWATAKAKSVNGEVQIQALVDGKKVIVTKTSVRRALQLKMTKGPRRNNQGGNKRKTEVPYPNEFYRAITDGLQIEEHCTCTSMIHYQLSEGKETREEDKQELQGLKGYGRISELLRIESSKDERSTLVDEALGGMIGVIYSVNTRVFDEVRSCRLKRGDEKGSKSPGRRKFLRVEEKNLILDDEVAIDVIPLATKSPIIVDWKIIKEGKMGYFQIIE